ncbi:MAG TPA: flagellar basal body-associated protein FliL [Xanthobacteraceae bacterium]|jgi:flagellar FliL protein|nr:flagellar basal body-associated protein FliL [Xanthobacteraceae bacterium]
MAANANEATADIDAEADEGGAAAKKKLPLKLIAIAGAALLMVAGGGTGAYVMFSRKHKAPEEEKAHAPVMKPVAFLEVPDVMVNLSNPGSDRNQFLKVKIVLEVADQELVKQIQPVMPRVLDAFQTYLRELRPMDLEGSAGLYRLKEELTRRINVAIEPARINAVLFKEILIQ